MDQKGFKDYIEKRTVKEIMEDYGEQKDEWERLLIVRNGETVYKKDTKAVHSSKTDDNESN